MAKRPRNPSQMTTQTTINAQSQNGSALNVLDKKHARRDAKSLGLHKADLPNSIKEIIATLVEAGYEAYIVGGGVRDALLGLTPKDFDAVTNATPSQIKDVFGKRCRIIGRRFQLCHVYSGRDMIEVATFRAPPKDNTFTTDEGMLTRDNVWGDIYQDAVRRDFSINALYYQPLEGFVYDFCGGLADITNKTLRLLGDAQKRVEEDPVRLLRALRFKAKLGFRFSTDLENQFNTQNWAFIAHVSPHRLYDETQKMFTGGYLVPLLPLLFTYRAFEHLIFYPPTAVMPLVERVAINTDNRINEGKSINPAFFYAAILWENYLFLLDKFKKNMPFAEAQHHAANKVMDKQRTLTAMPKFAEQFIKDIWLLQPRLAEPRRKNIQKLFENPRFRAGFDFLHLREIVQGQNQADVSQSFDTESTHHMGDWWAWFQTLNIKQQAQAIAEFDLEKVKQRFGGSKKNSHASTKNSKRKTRLSQQEQGEKDQLRQLSLATPQPTQTAKPLWETAETLEKNEDFDQKLVETGGYDLENFDAPHQSRRERRIANQALKQGMATVSEVRLDEKPRAPSKVSNNQANPRRANRVLEQAVPTHRKRREPSSDVSVLEKALMEKGNLPKTNLATNSTSLVETVEPKTVERKPRTRKPKVATIEVTEQTMADSNTASLPKKIPAKRARKKIVGTQTVKEAVKNPEIASETLIQALEPSIETVATTLTEKLPVKRGRKPSAVVEVENGETNEMRIVEPQLNSPLGKIPAKRTRKKVVE